MSPIDDYFIDILLYNNNNILNNSLEFLTHLKFLTLLLYHLIS